MSRKPTFGHSEVDYPVWPICKKFNLRYVELDDELNKQSVPSSSVDFIAELQLLSERIEAATISIVFAACFLDQFIFRYGCDYFGIEDCEKEFDRLSLRSKWLKIPCRAIGKGIPENSNAIQALDELVQVRHKIIHHKIFDMGTQVFPAIESTRSLAELTQKCARNTVPTVKALITELAKLDQRNGFQKFAADFLAQ